MPSMLNRIGRAILSAFAWLNAIGCGAICFESWVMLAPELGIIMPAACTARDRYHAEIASPWAVTASPWAVTYGRHDIAGKLVVDAGAGSGMQSRWMREAGARRVIVLELSHSVDGVMSQNLRGLDGVDIVQCSIDRPPLKDGCIDGIVICHNVIQHTPSVETTARALWALVAPGGEFAFNCYLQNTFSAPRRFRFWLYQPL